MPVARLLSYGNCNNTVGKSWPDYVAELSLTREHIPELIRMMTDKALWEDTSGRLETWAIVHAWRALAQLKAIEVIQPLIQLLDQYDEDDWLHIESPKVLGEVGAQGLPQLTEALADSTHVQWTRNAIAEGIENIAKTDPDHREECINILVKQLEAYESNEETLNGMLVTSLVELKVVDAAPLMEQAYASRKVDDMFAGTWARVQVDLGLKQESDFSPDDFEMQYHKNLRAAQLILSPDYVSGDATDSADWRDWPIAPPSRFGQEPLEIPKQSMKPVQGFGQSGSGGAKGSKKKKKK